MNSTQLLQPIKAPYLIGIDPGANTGVCLYRRSDKQFEIHTVPPWDFIDLVDPWIVERGVEAFHCIMEDPRQNSPVFPRDIKARGKKRDAIMQNIGQKVGMNKRDTDWLEYFIEGIGLPLTLIKPTQAKWDAGALETYTGYTGRTNQHVRDSISLVYGR